MRSLSLLLLLAAVCLLAVSSCLVSAQGPDPLEFLVVTCVGCKAGIHPIISNNGTVNPEWTTLTPYLTRDFEYPTYSLSFATGAPAGLSQDYRIDYQSTEDSVATTSMGFEESTVFTQQATPTSSRTLCRKDGQIDMLMTLTLTKAGVRTHQLGWTFRKRCTVPLIQIGTTPYDFDVANGTAAAAEFGNWVVQGPVLSLYMYLLNPVAAPGTIATEAPFTLSFTTSGMNQQLTIGTWTYNSTDPLSGNPGVYVLQDASHPIGQLDIPFICQQPQSYQTVTVTLDYNYVAPQGSQALTPLVFSFVKECLQFTIVTGLDIGSQSGTSDIAAAGEPTIHWQTIQPWTYHANQIPNFQFDQYFCLGCGAVFPVPADSITFQITYDILEEGILAINWLSQSNGGAGVVQSGKENELTMSATVQCLQPGTAQVNWEAFLGPTNEIIAYGFTYPCIFPLLDVVYGSATGTPVATQTVPTAQWNGQNEAAVIAGDETTSVFFFYLDQANNPAELANQQYQLSFIVDPAVMGDPTVDDRQMYNAAYLENSQGTSITWDCIAPGDTTVTMIVNYGWAQPMKIAFTKQCPEAHHSSGGWSAAGVFFFVVFLLGLAFCLGGCAFNYFKQDKRGLSIVPLYGSASACYDKYIAKTDRQWTPQMNTSSQTNYSSYQDEASYQSNL